MMKRIAIILASALLVCCLLSGCHGSRGLEAFVIPEEFDTSKDYEITFWAKNDTNKAQTDVYKKAIEDSDAMGLCKLLDEGRKRKEEVDG